MRLETFYIWLQHHDVNFVHRDVELGVDIYQCENNGHVIAVPYTDPNHEISNELVNHYCMKELKLNEIPIEVEDYLSELYLDRTHERVSESSLEEEE